MFNKEECFILKELVQIEIEAVKSMIQLSNDTSDAEELKSHLNKLISIEAKFSI